MKKFLALILTTALCLSLVACGDEDSSGSSSSSGNGFGDNKTPTIAVGETATTKKCEFTVDYINITNDVKPPNPSNFYLQMNRVWLLPASWTEDFTTLRP